jgi:hypothetical protein
LAPIMLPYYAVNELNGREGITCNAIQANAAKRKQSAAKNHLVIDVVEAAIVQFPIKRAFADELRVHPAVAVRAFVTTK